MKTVIKEQKGFGLIGLVAILALVLAVAIGSFLIVSKYQADDTQEPNIVPVQSQEIITTEDLQQTTDTLDEINIDELDTSELEAIESELL